MGRNKLPPFRKQTAKEIKARKREWAKSPVVEMPQCPACGSRGTRFPRSHDSMVRYGPNDFRCQECMNVFAVSEPDQYMCQLCRSTDIRDTPAGLMCQQHFYLLPNCDAAGCKAVAVDANKSRGSLCRNHLCCEHIFDTKEKKHDKREKVCKKGVLRYDGAANGTKTAPKRHPKVPETALGGNIGSNMSSTLTAALVPRKVRRNIRFTEPQYVHLIMLAEERGVGIPEVVRQLVDRSIAESEAQRFKGNNADQI